MDRSAARLATWVAWWCALVAVGWSVVVDPTLRSAERSPSTTGWVALVGGLVAAAAVAAEVGVRATRAAAGRVDVVVAGVLLAAPPAALVGLALGAAGGPDHRTTVVVAAAWIVGSTSVVGRRSAGRTRDGLDGWQRIGAIVEHGSDVVVFVAPDGVIRYASPGMARTLGHDVDSWIGRDVAALGADDIDRAAIGDRVRAATVDPGAPLEFEVALEGADGRRRHAEAVVTDRSADPAVGGLVVVFRDITEQRDLERRLSHRAFHDELTGLANRALFLDRMDHALRLTRHGGEPVMVLFIDLDDFKDVNDQHGHGIGDEVLRGIAERIRNATGGADTAARLGGDEFAVLLEDRGGLDRALELAERLLDGLREPFRIGNAEVVVLASIGIAVAPVGANTTSLLREADIAMYEAKRAGKGQIRIFDPAMRRVAARQVAYRSELARALEAGQLRVVYQPYIDLRSGEVLGAEALVRWHHPEHGEIPPAEFVPIAVRSGLIVQVGRWVVDTALDQVVGWRDDLDLFVSVNLTATELRQPDLIGYLVDTMRERRLAPSTLLLEVTESDLMDGGDRAVETVDALRRHGFRVALDDFGTGSCSITHLQRHPVDMVKVDRALVAELGGSDGDPTMVRAVLGLAGTLRIRSAAEAIETPEQLHELRRLGCDMGQGHLLAAPLEASVIARRFGRLGDVPACPG